MSPEEKQEKMKEFIELLDKAIEMGKELNQVIDQMELSLAQTFLIKVKERQESK